MRLMVVNPICENDTQDHPQDGPEGKLTITVQLFGCIEKTIVIVNIQFSYEGKGSGSGVKEGLVRKGENRVTCQKGVTFLKIWRKFIIIFFEAKF